MPVIVIKDYSWRQTTEFIILNIPLKGHPKKIDVFVIDNYIKISFPPFILELFLWTNVVEEESKCTLTEEKAILTLRKTNISLDWPTLEVQDISNDYKRDCRNRALEHAQKIAEEKTKLKSEKHQHLQKEAVKDQININTATLNKIDAMRDTHRKEAMREFEDWRSKAELPFLPNVEGKVQENRKAYKYQTLNKPPLKWFETVDNTLKSRSMTEEEICNNNVTIKELESKSNENSKILEINRNQENNLKIKVLKKEDFLKSDPNYSKDSESDYEVLSYDSVKATNKKEVDDVYKKEQKKRPGLEAVKAAIRGNVLKGTNIFEEPSKSIPLPRKMGTINVTFSERKFPTPARESSHIEEQKWLQKQAEARRKIGFDAEDLRLEERDPQWLKDKGDSEMASLYANRSAAHYALENYYKCMEDCSKALELMEPKCESNRESRAKCHARRGAALCKLSAPQHGIPELEAALVLTPDNESIKRDLLVAKQYFDMKD
ncbi:Dyslexia susceptibility 1 candidate 1 protein [Eufriesea mexicana]|nr:Dyslexia susceptibility 1 candidate 1 protein [Eufriesea mexicana]